MQVGTPLKPSVSIEAGHFYAADFAEGAKALSEKFQLVQPFVAATASRRTQASVCFMFDDYHNRPDSDVTPQQTYAQILEASASAGITIDYIAREAAGVQIAPQFLKVLGRSGLLRFTEAQGWLLKPQPRELQSAMAMQPITPSRHGEDPIQFSIELYDRPNHPKSDTESWSCPYLAAIWQALRLGALQDDRFDTPLLVSPDAIPDWPSWEATPALVQFNADAAPFVAEEAASILPIQFHPVEAAVGVILDAYGDATGQPRLDRRISRALIPL